MTSLTDLPPDLHALLQPAQAEAASTARVAFEHVGRRFDTPAGAVDALHDIDFPIHAGEIFGIIGRSGAGKSTLVRTINQLERPTSGRVLVNGVDLATLGEDALAQARRRIGMIFQHFNLLSSGTVAENIGLPLRIAGVPKRDIAARVDSLLELVGLSARRDAYPATLSGGQKQRVGIARALVHDPDILLCDEATSALDPETTHSILALLRDINRRLGLTVVLITHEMEVIREVCDRVAVLEKGRVVELGPVWRVFGAPQAEATDALLRPLAHDLPDDLRDRITATPSAVDDDLLLDVRLDGASGDDPDLARVAAALGRRVRLLHGGIERIQGRPLGRRVLALDPAGLSSPASALAASLGLGAERVRVLGYLNHA